MPSLADQVFRDFVTEGVPESGAHNPVKSEIRDLLDDAQRMVNVAGDAAPSGADWSTVVNDALTAASAAGLTGIYLPSEANGGPDEYQLVNISVPDNMLVLADKAAVIKPFGAASTVFLAAGDNIDFQLPNCVGQGPMETASGVGAVLTCAVPAGSLEASADSAASEAGITAWATSTSYVEGDVRRSSVSGITYSAALDHTSASSGTMEDEIALGKWLLATSGLRLRVGGSGYVTTGTDGIGSYFDFAVSEASGTGGVIRMYVTGGVITRAIVQAVGSGYVFDGGLPQAILVGRSYPTVWVQAVDRTNIRVRDSRMQYGRRAVDLTRCVKALVSGNTAYYMGPSGNAINIVDCVDSIIEGNTVDTVYGGLQNPGGIRMTGNSTDVSDVGLRMNTIRDNVVRYVLLNGVGIQSNVATIDGLIISGNKVEGCDVAQYQIKHGTNANGTTPGQVEEGDAGIRGVICTANYARLTTGNLGWSLHNNLRDWFKIEIGSTNVIESVGEKEDAVLGSTTGLVALNPSHSELSPTILGKFIYGMVVSKAWYCTIAPRSDGRCNSLVTASNTFQCRFPGEYTASLNAISITNSTRPIFNGTHAYVRGQPVSSVAVSVAGSGGPTSGNIPVYAHGGGYGLQLGCEVASGVLANPVIMPTIQETMSGANYFDGGSGTFDVRVRQNSGTSGILRVTVVDGECTAVSLVAGGSGYLMGGDTATGQLLCIEAGQDFVGYCVPDGAGGVSSVVVVDGGGHFRDTLDLAFPTGTFSVAPTLTVTLRSSGVVGATFTNVAGMHISGAFFEGDQNGIRTIGETVLDSAVFDSTFRSRSGPPLNIEGTAALGVFSNVTKIYGSGVTPVARTPASNAIWTYGEDLLINTASGAQTLKNIYGCVAGSVFVRKSSNSNALTIDNTGNIYLGGAGSITPATLDDIVHLRWNATSSKLHLI